MQPITFVTATRLSEADFHAKSALGRSLQVFKGPPAQECRLLDGVLLAVRKSTFDKTGIRFDERFDFHFYDLDFCRQCEAQRIRMGTIPLSIIHASGGSVFGSPSWRENYKKYLD